MNYYPFHLGDYVAHTSHLEPLEDLAYRRMLDAYYMREGALPVDPVEVARLIRMRQHQTEVEGVLREFFDKSDDGWHSKRADQELTTMLVKQEQKSAKNAHEAERMRRHRERRAEMFAALRALGIVPAWDVPMKELQKLHDENCNATETDLQREQNADGGVPSNADAMAIPIPTPTPTPNVIAQAEFDEFWRAYPKKKAKDAAMKAFAKRKPGRDLLDQMLAAIDAQKRSDDWLKDNGKFIPYPASWLNQGRWMDEIDAGPDSRSSMFAGGI